MALPLFIDTHHHLWDLENNPYPWLTEGIDHFVGDYSIFRRTYLISHLHEDARRSTTRQVRSRPSRVGSRFGPGRRNGVVTKCGRFRHFTRNAARDHRICGFIQFRCS